MLPANFMTTWSLSDSTKAKWTNGGTLILERRKKDILGRESLSAYKVFIKPATYLTIYEKNDAIRKKMDELKEVENLTPVNFVLYDRYIIQLSLFKRGKSLEPYYGIHILDQTDQIKIGCGLNLTEAEWIDFIQMLEEWYEGVIECDSKESKKEGEKKKKGKKRKTSIIYKSEQLCVTLYGWEWIYASEKGNGVNQGGLFINPSLCLQEAMKFRPEGDYHMETIEQKHFFDIDCDMIETAFGYLITRHIGLYKEARENYMNTEDCDLYERYGSEILGDISVGEIFDLCKMTITKYRIFTEEDNKWLMHLFSNFNKDESILNRLQKEQFKPYLMSLFEYVGGG